MIVERHIEIARPPGCGLRRPRGPDNVGDPRPGPPGGPASRPDHARGDRHDAEACGSRHEGHNSVGEHPLRARRLPGDARSRDPGTSSRRPSTSRVPDRDDRDRRRRPVPTSIVGRVMVAMSGGIIERDLTARLGRLKAMLETGPRDRGLSHDTPQPRRGRSSLARSRWRAVRGRTTRPIPANRWWATSASARASTKPGASSGIEAGLPPHVEHAHGARLAVDARLDPADEPVAEQERQDVVAPAPLLLRDVDLPDVVEAVQPAEEVAVPDERVERGEQRHAGQAAGLATAGDPAAEPRTPRRPRSPRRRAGRLEPGRIARP